MDTPNPTTGRPGERNRRELKKHCREILAEHIRQKTDVVVKPARVRLTNTAKDGYCWLYRPEAAHLFSKNLGEQKLSAYMEICSGLGVSFEAIAPSKVSKFLAPQSDSAENSTAETVDVQKPYDKAEVLWQQLLVMQQRLEVDEAEKERLRRELEVALSDCERLAQECRETADQFAANQILLGRCLHALDSIPTSLSALRDELCEAIKRNSFENC